MNIYDIFLQCHNPNCRPSLCTRLLYTVLPSPYTQKSFHDLLGVLTADLNLMYNHGYTAPWFNEHRYWFLLGPFFIVMFLGSDLPHSHISPSSLQRSPKVHHEEQKHHFRFVVVGVKGDWPFLRSSMGLNCGFNCIAKCHRCDVKDSQFPISMVQFFDLYMDIIYVFIMLYFCHQPFKKSGFLHPIDLRIGGTSKVP